MRKYFNRYNLLIKQGEDYFKIFQWLQGDGRTPVNITGYTGLAQIRETPQSQSVLATLSVAIVDADNGVFSLSLPSSSMNLFSVYGEDCDDFTQYVYDVVFTSSTSGKYRVLQGYANISPGVTK